MTRLKIVFYSAIFSILLGCGFKGENPFVGAWKLEGERIIYIFIEPNGNDFIAKVYKHSRVDGKFEMQEVPANIANNTLQIHLPFYGISGIYKENTGTLIVNGGDNYVKIDKDQAQAQIKVIFDKIAENEKICQALHKEADAKEESLKSKGEWNQYVRELTKKLPKGCRAPAMSF